MTAARDGGPYQPPEDLLLLLDPDPLRAQGLYRELARQLQRFLGYDCRDPDDAMQEVFARGFRRIREGVDTMEKGPRAYFFGIARNIMREHRKPAHRREQQLDTPQWDAQVSHVRETARMEALVELQQYLGRLDPFDAALLVRYCEGDREELMREHGLSAENLRITVFRIRERLRALREAAGVRSVRDVGADRNETPAHGMVRSGAFREKT